VTANAVLFFTEMGKYNNRWVGTEDDLLTDDYYEPINFDEYVSTAKDPGAVLLLFTIIFCIGSLIASVIRPVNAKEQDDADEMMVKTGYISIDSTLTVRTRKGLRGKKRYGGSPTVMSRTYQNITNKKAANRRFRITQGLGPQQQDIGNFVEDRIHEDTDDGAARLEVEDLLPNWNRLQTDDAASETERDTSDRQTFRSKFKKINRWLKSLGCVICSFNYSQVFATPKNRIGLKTTPSITPKISLETKIDSPTLNVASSTEVAPPLEQLTTENNNENNVHVTSTAKPQLDEVSVGEIEDSRREKEMEEIFNLAIPWTTVDLISYCADFFLIMIVSHFMGTATMICYSTVGFVLGCFNMLCSGIYGSCYKHVNNACADDRRWLAGEYIQISMVLNTIVTVPSSIVAVVLMPTIMTYYGYADAVVDMSQSYAAVAALHTVLEGAIGMVGTSLDIDGHAKFNAVWGLWESLVSVIATVVIISTLRPSLLGLGIYHLVESAIMHVAYIYIAYYRKGWLDEYAGGICSRSAMKNTPAVMSIIKRSVPLLLDDATVSMEWFVLSMFAAHQGAAESVVWILFSYIWEIVELVPESFADAATSRVAFNLSNGNVDIARVIAGQSIFLATAFAIILSIPLMVYRHFIVWCISADQVLDEMLLEVLPYVAFCQPFITLGMTAAAINEGMCLYHHVVKRMFVATCLVTIPVAGILTYTFEYNIEGLTAAVCMGYVTGGVFNFNLYMNADWEKAMRKNQEIIQYGAKQYDRARRKREGSLTSMSADGEKAMQKSQTDTQNDNEAPSMITIYR